MTFLVIAGISTIIFLFKFLMMFVGMGSEIDADFDHNSDMAFKLFSTQSILAFFMGYGWMGFSITNGDFSHLATQLIAFGFGVILCVLSSLLMYFIQKLEQPYVFCAEGKIGIVLFGMLPGAPGIAEVKVRGANRAIEIVSDVELKKGDLVLLGKKSENGFHSVTVSRSR